jgi:NAD(P)-dependent dehydrogenase (short-subunit alcohol dehydrogenase family)
MSAPVLLVTGADRGIGAAVALQAASEGYGVVIGYRTNARGAEELATHISGSGGHALPLAVDVTDQQSVDRLFKQVEQKFGRLDALVNNAGVIGGQHAVDALSAQLLGSVFATNVFGLFYCTGAAVRLMSTLHGGRGGAIVNVSSAAARHGGLPLESHYAASKGAVDSLTIALAKELASQGIRINGVRPGLIETGIHESHGGTPTIRRLESTIPLGRCGTADEVAQAILFLLSERAAYIHGTTVDVSGGR